MDFNPDEAIAAGWLRADSTVAKILEKLSRFSLRRANSIVALDRFMRDRITAKGIAPAKVVVIPPWSQDDDVGFDVSGRSAFRTKHGLDGKFVVAYSGNHSPVHPLDTLLQAANKLRDEKQIVFAFIGGGSEFAKVKKWAEGNPQALCLPYQPLNQLSASLSSADFHAVIIGNSMLGLVHPCKIYNMLAVGAPVIYIGPQPSHVTEILDQLGSEYPAIRVTHGAGDELARQIQRFFREHAKRRPSVPTQITAFSKAILLPQLIAVLEQPTTQKTHT